MPATIIHNPILPTELNPSLIEDHRLPKRLVNFDGHDQANTPRGIYMQLFHGRIDPDQDMDDWGSHCPDILGPFGYVQFTYTNNGRISYDDHSEVIWLDHNFSAEACHLMPPNSLCRHDDMLFWNGTFYGDWSFFWL